MKSTVKAGADAHLLTDCTAYKTLGSTQPEWFSGNKILYYLIIAYKIKVDIETIFNPDTILLFETN